jgi:hypothetical protein
MAIGPGRKAVALSAGYESVCVVLDHGGLRCFGKNEKGQLGLDNKWAVPFDKTPDLVIIGH